MLTNNDVKFTSYINEDSYREVMDEKSKVLLDEILVEKNAINKASIYVFIISSLVSFMIICLGLMKYLENIVSIFIVFTVALLIGFGISVFYKIMSYHNKRLVDPYDKRVEHVSLLYENFETIQFLYKYMQTGEVFILKKNEDDTIWVKIRDKEEDKEKEQKLIVVFNIIESDRNELVFRNDCIDAYLDKDMIAKIS